MLDVEGAVEWSQSVEGFEVTIGNHRRNKNRYALKIEL